jgi:hypothetical protein
MNTITNTTIAAQLAPSTGVRRGEQFLGAIDIQHGPADLLGLFFLQAEQAVRDRGILLEWGSFEDLLATNRANLASWGQLVRAFDCTKGPILSDKAFCIIGRNNKGEVVATQAARLYDTGEISLKEYMQSLTLFYPEGRPASAEHERCDVTAPAAQQIRGRIVYSGGGWYRRDFRGKELSALLPRLSRAYAFSRWGSRYTISMVAKPLIDKGVVGRYGYTNIEWGVKSSDSGNVYYEGALVWMDSAQLLTDLDSFVSEQFTKVDIVADIGGTQHKLGAIS